MKTLAKRLTIAVAFVLLLPLALAEDDLEELFTFQGDSAGDEFGKFVDIVGNVDGDGVYVESAGGDGVSVLLAGDDGVHVHQPGNDGVHVESAGSNGVSVYQAGNDGVVVGVAGNDGVYVYQAGSPSAVHLSGADNHNGFEVAGAQGDGIWVGRADTSGIAIGSAGSDGLDDLRHIAGCAYTHLREGARLMLEHGFDQAEPVRRILEENSYRDITAYRDMAGRPRVTTGSR